MTNFSSRRRSLRFLASAPLVWLTAAIKPIGVFAADWPKALFSVPTSQDAINQLGAKGAEAGKRILLEVPEISDINDRVVVRVMSTLPATEQITILIDKALRPVVAQFNFSPDVEPDVSTIVKLPGTTTVRAIVKAGGKIYSVEKEIKLALEAWDGPVPTLPDAPNSKSGKKGKSA